MSDGNGHAHLELLRPSKEEVLEAEVQRLTAVCAIVGEAYDNGTLDDALIDLMCRTLHTITSYK